MTITLSSLSKVARAAAFILTACGTIAFAQPKAEKVEVAPRTLVNTDEAGILVSSVESGSPAEKAGIARGDIILEVGGTAVNDYAALQSAIGSRKPGDKVEVKIRHGDTESTVSLTLANKSGKPYAGVSVSPSGRGSLSQRKLDRQRNPRATPLLPAPQPRLMLTGPGAVISKLVAGGPAEKAGLKKGDIIESVDGTAIDAANSLSGLITARKVGDSVALSVRTDAQEPRDVKVVLEKNPEKDAPYLGVEYAMVNRRFGQAVPMPWGAPGPMAGVLVSSVAADSPAAKAGLKDQDLITAIEGVPVGGESGRGAVDLEGHALPGERRIVGEDGERPPGGGRPALAVGPHRLDEWRQAGRRDRSRGGKRRDSLETDAGSRRNQIGDRRGP